MRRYRQAWLSFPQDPVEYLFGFPGAEQGVARNKRRFRIQAGMMRRIRIGEHILRGPHIGGRFSVHYQAVRR